MVFGSVKENSHFLSFKLKKQNNITTSMSFTMVVATRSTNNQTNSSLHKKAKKAQDRAVQQQAFSNLLLTNCTTNQTAIWVLTQNCYQLSHKRNKRTRAARDKQRRYDIIKEPRVT
jgi:hypothetical protein